MACLSECERSAKVETVHAAESYILIVCAVVIIHPPNQ